MSFEEELLADLNVFIKAGNVSIKKSSDVYFNRLAEFFPLYGSKIHWGKVADSVVDFASNKNDVTEWVIFFNSMVKHKGLSGKVIYLNDSAIECVLIISLDTLSKCIQPILEFPDHHYFIAEDYAWCMCFTMEGDMTFGFKP